MGATSVTNHQFEDQVRRRCLSALNRETAMAAGGLNGDVSALQQYACHWIHIGPEQTKNLARYFNVSIPPGYGSTGKAA
jgi:hypothetical protein